MTSTIVDAWRAGQRRLGLWTNLADAHATEVLAHAGCDWICIDLQHGLAEIGDLQRMLPGVEKSPAAPVVRVRANASDQIGRVLDLGAAGVIVPMVSTVAEARAAAEACRFPPRGARSCGPVRAAMHDGGYLGTADDSVACIVMIETAEGLASVEAIAATEGVDALFVGPFDLSYAIGVGPAGMASEAFAEALARIRAAAAAAGKPAGIFGASARAAAHALGEGFAFASVGVDVNLLRAEAVRALALARGDETAS
ncbi:MAG: aldolase/citrate lyase family protein [Pseudomonadales bacterium]|jgi:4-hydroxy-2-oxoheptanedioate aldolase|nr:aldolase/citrate lyase family protein [Pseudomonadales bacterium]